jgi:hypothetical protein
LSDGNNKPEIDEEHYRKITQSLSNDLCRRYKIARKAGQLTEFSLSQTWYDEYNSLELEYFRRILERYSAQTRNIAIEGDMIILTKNGLNLCRVLDPLFDG